MAASKWTTFYKVVTPKPSTTKMTDSQEMTDVGAYNNYTWYQRLIQGSASRMTRYREYDLMDNDVEVARALDTIAEEMQGNSPRTDEPLVVDVLSEDEENIQTTAVLTIRAALRRWSQIHDWENQLFPISRLTIKYGDVFFRKRKDYEKWIFIHPKNVIAAIVDQDDVTKILAWQIKKDTKEAKGGGYGMPLGAKQASDQFDTEIVYAKNMVRFSLADEMSDSQPFGESVLRPVYRAHKQKELLEDAVVIYRIQRAPERRVFYIDVGKMPPQRVKAYLEGIKNEIKQKKIPTINGGKSDVDSVYNPQSMSEDFYFASRPDGRGSRVETLPGGQGLGELEDLLYFQKKVWRGLRVPISYMMDASDGGAVWNDGKVGTAYIEELRFALFVQRLQAHVEKVLDEEFKKFLRKANIFVDENSYRLRLPPPTNFGKYRQLEMDGQLLGLFGSADAIPYMAKRFAMQRYLQMSDEDMAENEFLLREERGMDEVGDESDLPTLYGNPEQMAAAGGAGGAPAVGGGFGGTELGMEAGAGAEGEMGGEGGEMAPPEPGTAPPPPI